MKRQFTHDELLKVCSRIDKYCPAVNPWQLRFFWSDRIGSKNGILGKFYISDKIVLPLEFMDEILNGNRLDSTICHELFHCLQFREQGLFRYAILNLFRYNEIAAKKEERRVDELLGLDDLNT